jgi:hypothetical protein
MMWRREAKKWGQRSQIANVVLHLRFVPASHDLDKRLIRLRLGMSPGPLLSVPVQTGLE